MAERTKRKTTEEKRSERRMDEKRIGVSVQSVFVLLPAGPMKWASVWYFYFYFSSKLGLFISRSIFMLLFIKVTF